MLVSQALGYAKYANNTEGKPEAKCPFGFKSSSGTRRRLETTDSDIIYPAQLYVHADDTVMKTTTFTIADYEELIDDTITEYEKLPVYVKETHGDENERSAFVGCILRQAGHDLMDFRHKPDDEEGEWDLGGSDGCVHYEDHDNVGLT
jgi:hypothetical protein